MSHKDTRLVGFVLAVMSFFAVYCGGGSGNGDTAGESLTIYSGRSETLVGPVIEAFREATGTEVEVRYGDTSQLALALVEEGEASETDVFWAQDAGALGALASENLFSTLPDSITRRLAPGFRSENGEWVATSGRARVLAYSTARVDSMALPTSIMDLTEPRFAHRVGWAPTNGSFQSFISAMRELEGDAATRAWLEAMKENGAKSYPKNSAILQGIANGEVDFGLPNHYYLHRFKNEDENFPVGQTFFEAGDPGNLVNVAGAGVLSASTASSEAHRFVSFLLSPEMQAYFRENTFEYPVTQPEMGELYLQVTTVMPTIDLNTLRNLESTLDMLREVELL